ncbi:MAG: hypothetical protein WCA08_23105 [Desulfoferrobacter sp.]
MPDGALAERVDSLESYMKDLSYQALKTERELARLSVEMREFKDEMREFKDRSEQDRRQMNRKWGELANKMGTLIEDIVAPNLPRVAKEVFDCPEPSFFTVHPRKRKGSGTLELDALVVCEKVVLLSQFKTPKLARGRQCRRRT